jgi:CubicO group peptidase (beta-lactamase class C family)
MNNQTLTRPNDISQASTASNSVIFTATGPAREDRFWCDSDGTGRQAVSVNELKVDVDAAEAGLDAERLKRVDTHLAGYVADGRLPGWLLTVRRHGRLAHVARCGSRDLEAGLPVTDDTLWRIYSMTKPVTSVAAMMLYEEGRLALTDPVSAFIPAFNDVRVYAGGSDLKQQTVPSVEPVRIWHLLTHTAGLTYGFHRVHPVDALHRAAGFEWDTPPDVDLAQACDLWAGFPLLFQPGTEWNYSVATDVLGRVVEVASGQPLDEPPFIPQVRTARRPGSTPWAGRSARNRACSAGAAAWCPRRPTTTGSPRCCCTGRTARPASSTASSC